MRRGDWIQNKPDTSPVIRPVGGAYVGQGMC